MEERRELIEQLNELTKEDVGYTEIKVGENTCKLYKSLSNKRLPEESFDEYKLRQYINKKLIKKHKEGFLIKNDNL